MQLKTRQSKKILKINWKFLETKAIVKPDLHLTIVRQYFKLGVKQKERLPRFCSTPANQHPLFSMQRNLFMTNDKKERKNCITFISFMRYITGEHRGGG